MSVGESITELSERLRRLEGERGGTVDILKAPTGEAWAKTLAERQLAARLERREIARREGEARGRAEHKRRRRRSKLEAALQKVREDRGARLEQHDRARQRIVEGFAQPMREAENALEELAAEIEREVAEVRNSPIKVKVPR